jgi:hypothetical protein
MMEMVVCLAPKFYSWLLKIYPSTFRKEFGEEMIEVFTMAISQAGGRGWYPLLGLIFEELARFPFNLMREHAHEFTGAASFDRWITSPGRLFPICAGIFGYGSGFALMSAIQGLLVIAFPGNPSTGLFPQTFILVFAKILAGGLGGFSLGLAMDYKNRRRFAIIGAASYPFGIYFISQLIRSSITSIHRFGSILELPGLLLNFILLGVFLKALLDYTDITWKQMPVFILAGAFGVLFGFLANRLSVALMQSYLRYPGWPNLPTRNWNYWYFLFKVGPNSLFGAVMGAWLGLAASQVRTKRLASIHT